MQCSQTLSIISSMDWEKNPWSDETSSSFWVWALFAGSIFILPNTARSWYSVHPCHCPTFNVKHPSYTIRCQTSMPNIQRQTLYNQHVDHWLEDKNLSQRFIRFTIFSFILKATAKQERSHMIQGCKKLTLTTEEVKKYQTAKFLSRFLDNIKRNYVL